MSEILLLSSSIPSGFSRIQAANHLQYPTVAFPSTFQREIQLASRIIGTDTFVNLLYSETSKWYVTF